MKNRYGNLLIAINETAGNSKGRPYRIVEIGVYSGDHAELMIQHVQKTKKGVEYYGFDLFDKLTPELLTKEKSKPKPPPPAREVMKRLRKTGATVFLMEGFTSETLPAFLEKNNAEAELLDGKGAKFVADLIFIDGGHSLETIANDWKYSNLMMGPETICIFDDYYPDREDFGCKTLIDNLPRRNYDVELLGPIDHYEHTKTTVQFVKVRHRDSKS